MNENGQKRSRYVYANGGVLAREQYFVVAPNYRIAWQHETPVTGDRVESGSIM